MPDTALPAYLNGSLATGEGRTFSNILTDFLTPTPAGQASTSAPKANTSVGDPRRAALVKVQEDLARDLAAIDEAYNQDISVVNRRLQLVLNPGLKIRMKAMAERAKAERTNASVNLLQELNRAYQPTPFEEEEQKQLAKAAVEKVVVDDRLARAEKFIMENNIDPRLAEQLRINAMTGSFAPAAAMPERPLDARDAAEIGAKVEPGTAIPGLSPDLQQLANAASRKKSEPAPKAQKSIAEIQSEFEIDAERLRKGAEKKTTKRSETTDEMGNVRVTTSDTMEPSMTPAEAQDKLARQRIAADPSLRQALGIYLLSETPQSGFDPVEAARAKLRAKPAPAD